MNDQLTLYGEGDEQTAVYVMHLDAHQTSVVIDVLGRIERARTGRAATPEPADRPRLRVVNGDPS